MPVKKQNTKVYLHCESVVQSTTADICISLKELFLSCCSLLFQGALVLPTSHVKVSRWRVAHACAVGRHTLVFALVRLLAVLDLQRSCGREKGPIGGERKRYTTVRVALQRKNHKGLSKTGQGLQSLLKKTDLSILGPLCGVKRWLLIPHLRYCKINRFPSPWWYVPDLKYKSIWWKSMLYGSEFAGGDSWQPGIHPLNLRTFPFLKLSRRQIQHKMSF